MDYVIEETHQSKCHPMSMKSNYTYKIIAIFDNKEAADNELKKDKYKWRGNGTGSVSFDVRERKPEDKMSKY